MSSSGNYRGYLWAEDESGVYRVVGIADGGPYDGVTFKGDPGFWTFAALRGWMENNLPFPPRVVRG